MALSQHQFDGLRGRLLAALISVEDRLGQRDAQLIHEFIDAGELGLALEQVADVLCEDEMPISDEERATLLTLNRDMHMGERVPNAIGRCPRLSPS